MSEKDKEYMKAWRKKNAASIKAKKAAAYQANKEAIKAKQRAYTAANKEAISARSAAKYRAENPNPAPRGKVPFTEKVCPACGVLKLRSKYYKKLTTVSHQCKRCTDLVTTLHRKANPKLHLNYGNKSRNARYAKDPEYRASLSVVKKVYRAANIDDIKTARRERYATDAEYRASCLAYNRRNENAQPPWADKKAIRAVYKTCPEGHHVDHVIPLKGKIDGRQVSGLHIAANLQHLTAAANLKKNCRITEADLD